MTISYVDDQETLKAFVRDELQRVGDSAAAAAAADDALRAARNELVVESYAAGMTQTEIAHLVHLDQSMVSKILRAHRRANLLRDAQQTMQDGTTKGEMR